MSTRSCLTEKEKGQILAFKEQNLSNREIGKKIGRHHTVIGRFLKNPNEYGTKHSSGRPEALSERTKRKICREAANTTKGSRRIRNSCASHVSHVTVWKVLKNSPHLQHVKMLSAPTLKVEHERNRSLFADKHQTWTHEWDKVLLFSSIYCNVFLMSF